MKNFYSQLASEIYKRPYEDCLPTYFNGSPNIEGKILITAATQVVIDLQTFIRNNHLTLDKTIEILKHLKENNNERSK